MKVGITFLIVLLISACGGGSQTEVNERELYGKKRVDCETTKSYSPDNYDNIY